MDGTVWTTDKDGIILDLLAAEITARHGPRSRRALRGARRERFGEPVYARIDAPATPAQKAALAEARRPSRSTAATLAGEPILAKLTRAPGNGAPIGGLKVVTDEGWFAARPSGTEDVYKIYAESFRGRQHLARIQAEAHAIVRRSAPRHGARLTPRPAARGSGDHSSGPDSHARLLTCSAQSDN